MRDRIRGDCYADTLGCHPPAHNGCDGDLIANLDISPNHSKESGAARRLVKGLLICDPRRKFPTNEACFIALVVAHNWYSGYHDPVTGYECCDDKKDCRVISPRYVEPLPGGDFNIRTGLDAGISSPRNALWRVKTASITSARPPRL